jgi:NADH dehydrogenase/NADH:ubiquinone oxidoreductase subunit G
MATKNATQVNKEVKTNKRNLTTTEPKLQGKPVNKEVKEAKVSKRLADKMDKIANFKIEEANGFQKLLHIANVSEVESYGLNKALNLYIKNAEATLTASQMELLTFANIKEFINKSKRYASLPVFTFHQITLIVNAYIKEYHAPTKLTARAMKQGAKVMPKGKK